jgi:hypothetical protein
MEFKKWLFLQENASSPGAKQVLYPMGYGGIGLYPPSDVMTWGADAMTYMPEKVRSLKFIWGDGILKNPFEKGSLYQRIENKKATQIQAGNLKINDDGFKKTANYSNEISLHVVQIGGLSKDGKSFEKSSAYSKRIPKGIFWDYKQLGDRPGKLILPIKQKGLP